jgi:hypothetical protein
MLVPGTARCWTLRWLAVGALVATLVIVACGGDEGDDEEEKPASAPPRVAVEGGETVVTLDAAALAHAGLVVGTLPAASHVAQVPAYGAVLDLTGLAEARGEIAAAGARVAKAHAELTAARFEYERTNALHAHDRAASEKALEAATAVLHTDDAEVRAADAALASLSARIRQRWGGVIGGWLAADSPRVASFLGQQERLVQLTVPSGIPLASPPPKAILRARGGPGAEASLVSAAPRTDARIQGTTLFYAVPVASCPLPGASVVADLPVGPSASGVAVPASAVVWWQGRAWVYEEKAPGRFVRRDVPTDAPLPTGWFVAKGLTVGERVVLQGAQVLLSEEGRTAVHGSEG